MLDSEKHRQLPSLTFEVVVGVRCRVVVVVHHKWPSSRMVCEMGWLSEGDCAGEIEKRRVVRESYWCFNTASRGLGESSGTRVEGWQSGRRSKKYCRMKMKEVNLARGGERMRARSQVSPNDQSSGRSKSSPNTRLTPTAPWTKSLRAAEF